MTIRPAHLACAREPAPFPEVTMLGKLFSLAGRAQSRKPARAARLRLETLEGRDVPSTYYVTSGADSGSGTLREAIEDAQQVLDGLDTIVITDDFFAVELEEPLPVLYETMSIVGETTAYDDGRVWIKTYAPDYQDFRFIETGTNGVTLTLDNLRITGFGTSGDGGAILYNGELNITNCRISDCIAGGNGGALATGTSSSTGVLNMSDCYLDFNYAGGDGGALYSYPALSDPIVSIETTIIEDNEAGGDGGGIWAASATGLLYLDEVQIESNEAAGTGGAIYVYHGALEYYTSNSDPYYGAQGNEAGFVDGIYIYEPSYVIIDAQCYNPTGSGTVEIYIVDYAPYAGYISINYSLVYGGSSNVHVES